MSEQWWEVFYEHIRPVTVVKETEKTVTVQLEGGYWRRLNKRGRGWSFFKSKTDAIDFVENKLYNDFVSAQEGVKYAQERLDKFREEHKSFVRENCEHIWLDAVGYGDFCDKCGVER